MKQTAVEWLLQVLDLDGSDSIAIQAKEMEKEQMLQEFGRGYDEGLYDGIYK